MEVCIGLCLLLSVKLRNFCFQHCAWFLSIHCCCLPASNLAVRNICTALYCACAFLTGWPVTSKGKGYWCGFVLLWLEKNITNTNSVSRICSVHSPAVWVLRLWVCSSSQMTALYPRPHRRTHGIELTPYLCWAFWQFVVQFAYIFIKKWT